MEEKELILPITVVAEYLYCPRSCFYKIFRAEENDGQNISIIDGRNRHDIIHQETNNANKKSNISVFSHSLGLSGKLDLLEISDDKYTPVEYKRGRTRDFLSIKIQLCLYALCIEEMYKTKIDIGYIYFSEDNKRMSVEIDKNLRDMATKVIKEIHDKIASNNISEFPQINNSLCEKCSYFQPCIPFLKDFL